MPWYPCDIRFTGIETARDDAMVTVGFIGAVCSIWAWEGGEAYTRYHHVL